MAKKEKATGKDLVKWEEQLAKYAQDATKGAKVEGSGKFISFKAGQMTFGGETVEDNELRCVIVGWTHHNAYYDPDVPYNPKQPSSPICYAFGQEQDEMMPHADSPEVQNDNDGCASCPFNQFESDPKGGRGKACKNTVRVALIAESDLEDLDEAEVVYANVPPTSIKNFMSYILKEVRDKQKRPHWAVVTTMKLISDASSQFKVTFKMEELVEDSALFDPLHEIWEKTMEGIDFPYKQAETPPAGKAAKSAPAKNKKFAKR